jgi:hypothetical protein
MSNQQIIIQNYNKNMSGLTIEEAQEHIEVLKSKMEEEINYYKTEIQLALQDADHDKKWEDYQKYLNEWEQNAEETENERQIKISQSYRADSNYDFWENYDEREDYNSKSEEEEASENSCEEDDAEEDDADEDDANSDEEEADSDEEDADSDEDESKERDDNVVTYQLLQSMFDYKNAEPEDCCFCKSEEEEEEESRLDQLQKKIDGIDNVVYQLLGGMFNHETQSNILDFHLRTLSWKKNTNTDTDSNDEEFLNESAWPTTRQGDQNEEDIRLLKQQVLKLEETNNYLIRIIKEQLGINL